MTFTSLRAAALIAVSIVVGAGSANAQSTSGASNNPFVDPVPVVRIGPPSGWEYAFEDDRLNPNRARRTVRGDAQSSQIWTDTVPRRAIPLPPNAISSAVQQKH